MKKWVCNICGYVFEGDELPADFKCPVCKAPASKLTEQAGEMAWAAEHVVGVGKSFGEDVPAEVQEEIIAGLRANFE
ncbi:MAG: NADH peroxidase, partial [Oscillospiraceae bacterium]|nr:NADH peroxidase [Oscillospiraceae bacterium]